MPGSQCHCGLKKEVYILGGNIPVILIMSLTQEPELGSYFMHYWVFPRFRCARYS